MAIAATDHALLSRYASARDAEAFSELVRRYSALVFGVARRITGNAADAEDVAQECFFELAQKAGSVTTALPGWLHRAATYRAIDHVRHATARHEKRASGEEEAGDAAPAEDTSWKELSPHVDRALEELPDELRVPLIMHFFQGRTHAEVADELGIPRRTITNRLQDAIETLRAGLKRHGVERELSLLPALLAANALPPVPTSLTIGLTKIGLAGVGGHAATAAAATTSVGLAWGLGAAVIAVASAIYGGWRMADSGGRAADNAPPAIIASQQPVARPDGHLEESPAAQAILRAASIHHVLLIGGTGADDGAIRAHLTASAVELRVIDDASATLADTEHEDLVLVSQSVKGERLLGKLHDCRAPIIVWEVSLWPDLGLVSGPPEIARDADSLRICAPEHPLAAGLDGVVRVTSAPAELSGSSGRIGAGTLIATVEGQPKLAALFAFDAGQLLADGKPAPARRVGFFLYDQGPAAITADGWKLLDAAVTWCLEKPKR